MKILHTADWHLGKKLNEHPRHAEQVAVLDEICRLAEEHAVDAVVVAGDLFDTFNPGNESNELYYKTLRRLSADGSRLVVAIAGNHDSPDRIEAPEPLARECGILLAGYPNSTVTPFALPSGLKVLQAEEGFAEIQLPQVPYPLRVLLTPYANEQRVRQLMGSDQPDADMRALLRDQWAKLAEKHCDEQGVNLLVAHLFMMAKGGEKPEEPEDEKQVLHVGGAQVFFTEDIPPQIQYTALGHLHRYHNAASKAENPALYSGSLLSYSFSEAGQEKYVVLVEAEPGKPVSYQTLPLQSGRQLHRKRFESADEALQWLGGNPETYVELTLRCENYLEAETKRALYQAHDGIVALIPELTGSGNGQQQGQSIDISQDTESLFQQYFQDQKGVPPSEELMSLFREVLHGESGG